MLLYEAAQAYQKLLKAILAGKLTTATLIEDENFPQLKGRLQALTPSSSPSS